MKDIFTRQIHARSFSGTFLFIIRVRQSSKFADDFPKMIIALLSKGIVKLFKRRRARSRPSQSSREIRLMIELKTLNCFEPTSGILMFVATRKDICF